VAEVAGHPSAALQSLFSAELAAFFSRSHLIHFNFLVDLKKHLLELNNLQKGCTLEESLLADFSV